jgi:hypothetical protein
MEKEEIERAKQLALELQGLIEKEDYGGRYEQALRDFCGVLTHWATARDGSGTYPTLRLPNGRTVRILPHRAMAAKTRAWHAWLSC